MNYNLFEIYVQNNLNKLLIISQKIYIECVVKYKADECYLISSENTMFIINKDINLNDVQLNFKELLIITVNTFFSETKLFNEVIVFKEKKIFIIK